MRTSRPAYYTPGEQSDPVPEAKQWLELVLSEDEAMHGDMSRSS
jgi:hypothetical protein